MNTRIYSIIVGSVLFSACMKADPEKFIYIGDIPATCPISIKRSAVQLPSGFQVSSEEAVRRASEEANIKCNSVFEQVVYADAENYYIIKPAFGSMSEKAKAVIIDAATGKVSVRGD